MTEPACLFIHHALASQRPTRMSFPRPLGDGNLSTMLEIRSQLLVIFRIHKKSLYVTLLLPFILAFFFCLPSPLFNKPLSPVLFSQKGELLDAQIATDGQWRFPAITDSLPHRYQTALLAFEDRHYYTHWGVDQFALLRAMGQNIRHHRIVSGASTLTMQTIRAARKNPSRTLPEKLIEAIMAVRLECSYSKVNILRLYAANAPFGGNIVGLEAASWRYFGRSPGELSWAEAALLAVLPNNPAMLHLQRQRGRLLQKRNHLLERLWKDGTLDSTQYALACGEGLPAAPQPFPHQAAHLMTTLLEQWQGPVLRTSLEQALQAQVTQVASQEAKTLRIQGIDNMAVLVIDNRTLAVKAYLGNTPSRPGVVVQGHFVDLIRAERSTGSILKPLLYASMLQSGEILPNTLVPDVPVSFGGYMPQNYDRTYRGAVAAKIALAQSLNVPATGMLKDYGVDRFYGQLQSLGMTTLHRRADDYGLSLILGGAEGSLWDITGMYASMARAATQYNEPQSGCLTPAYVLVSDSSNSSLHKENCKSNLFSPSVAWLTMSALREVNRPDVQAFWSNFSSSMVISWKTGTSFGHRDAWAVGCTPDYTVGVWVGNADGEGRPEIIGRSAAAPVLFRVFAQLPHQQWFNKPILGWQRILVCPISGYPASPNCPRSDTIEVPAGPLQLPPCPFHRKIFTDPTGKWRVHAACSKTLIPKFVFILPADQQFYFHSFLTDATQLPPWHPSCGMGTADQDGPMVIYPAANAQIYLPIDLDSKQNSCIFQATHRHEKEVLFWHLDGKYLGSTTKPHTMEVLADSGSHHLTIVDDSGNQFTRQFVFLRKQ